MVVPCGSGAKGMVNSQIPGLLTHGLGTGRCAVLRGGSLTPASVATRHEFPELGIAVESTLLIGTQIQLGGEIHKTVIGY